MRALLVRKIDYLLMLSMMAVVLNACSPEHTQSFQSLIAATPKSESTHTQVSILATTMTAPSLEIEVTRGKKILQGTTSTESPAPQDLENLASSGNDPGFEREKQPTRDSETKQAPPEDNSIVSSSGQQTSISGGGGKPGVVSGYNPNQGVSTPSQPMSWMVYTDNVYRFSISYPDLFTVMPEDETVLTEIMGLVHRVRFQDKQLLNSEVGFREPAKFSIEVFQKGISSFDQWVASLAGNGELESVNIGNIVCTRESLQILIAPNVFFYCASDVFYYRLTPLGKYAEDMLQSFRLLP